MDYYPVNLRIRGQNVAIVGGGRIALRKCLSLLPLGARVTVIAPEMIAPLRELRDQGKISHCNGSFVPDDLDGAFLVIAATNDPAVNRTVAAEAAARHLLVAVTDDREQGNVTTPAVLRRGALTIAVSTEGKSPALARTVRDELAQRYGDEHAEAVTLLGAVREKLLTTSDNTAYNKQILNDLASSELIGLLKRQQHQEIDRLLTNLLGTGFTTADLGVHLKDRP